VRSKTKERPARRVRMPIVTDCVVPPYASAQITERSRHSFRPERLLLDHPKEWVVNQLQIARQSAWRGHARGGDFAVTPRASFVWAPFVNKVVRRGQDVVLVVTYVGRLKRGRPFRGTIVGSAARLSPKEISR